MGVTEDKIREFEELRDNLLTMGGEKAFKGSMTEEN